MIPGQLVVWATAETNYPVSGNAWSGTPIIVAPASDYFTPNVKPPAENFNWILNAISGANNLTLQMLTSSAVSNWNAVFAGSGLGTTPFANVVYDPHFCRWITMDPNNTTRPLHSFDGAKTFVPWGTGGGFVGTGTCCADSNNLGEAIYLCPASPTGMSVSHYTSGFVGTNTVLSSFSGFGPVTPYNTCAAHFNGTWLAIGAHISSGGSAYAMTSPDGVTWSSCSLPSSFASTGAGVSAAGFYRYLTAQTGGTGKMLVSVNAYSSAGAVESFIMSTTNGTTFTDVTPAACTGTWVAGLTYSSVLQIWALATWNPTSGISYIYTSTDGVTWTLRITQGGQVSGVAFIGSLFVFIEKATTGFPDAQFHMGGSFNINSVSPTVNVFPYVGNVSSAGLTISNPSLASNGIQLVSWNDTNIMSSHVAGV